jgi:threonine/homoserine/homoserine lactone efflux protein
MIPVSAFTYLAMGAFFGLTAGISPGPLLTLVITETLKHDRKAGIKVAIAPLITDLPIILAISFIFSGLSQNNMLLGLISILGGIFFTFLGYETVKTRELYSGKQDENQGSLKKGIAANFLNPNPYIFWLTAGIPTAYKAYETGLITAIMYFIMFYLFLTGSKIFVAFLVEKSKLFLKNRAYRLIMQILGVALFLFAAMFFYDGFKMLK